MNNLIFEQVSYYALALDPIHVGVGGERLGRVDLPIIRDPGTDLPKIPGSSLSGSARTYTALTTGRYPDCAGRGGEGGQKHCGKPYPACPVCIPYGFSKGTGNSMSGLAQFFDAQVIFFPVASMVGPVWVTSPLALEGLGLQQEYKVKEERFLPLGETLEKEKRLNFGWIMLEKDDNQGRDGLGGNFEEIPSEIKTRAVLLENGIFSQVVNSNLEIRTSVSIDPESGTAEDGALFTYEALPRGTVFKFEINYNSGKYFKVGGKELRTEGDGDVGVVWVKNQVEKGLKLFESLGIGGMTTRGMGRIKVLNLSEVDTDGNAR